MVTVLLRPFPWEAPGFLQKLASLEGIALVSFAVLRRRSIAASLRHVRIVPFLFYCWIAHDPVLTHVPGVRELRAAGPTTLPRAPRAVRAAVSRLAQGARVRRRRAPAAVASARCTPAVARTSTVIRRGVKTASAAADRLRPVVPGVVVLLYHRVGGGSSREIDLDAAVFEEQIATIAASNRAVTLGDALAPPRDTRHARVGGRRDVRRRDRRLRRRRGADPRAPRRAGDALPRHRVRRGGAGAPRRRPAGVVVRAPRRVLDWTRRHRIAHAHAPAARPRLPVRGGRRARPLDRSRRRPARPARARLRVPEGGGRPAATWSGSCATGSGRPRSRAPASTRT